MAGPALVPSTLALVQHNGSEFGPVMSDESPHSAVLPTTAASVAACEMRSPADQGDPLIWFKCGLDEASTRALHNFLHLHYRYRLHADTGFSTVWCATIVMDFVSCQPPTTHPNADQARTKCDT